MVGGEGGLLAAGCSPFGIGSDIGGSIRFEPCDKSILEIFIRGGRHQGVTYSKKAPFARLLFFVIP